MFNLSTRFIFNDGEKKTDTLTLIFYPFKKSTFDLYEDDGLTRQYKTGAFAKMLIEVEGSGNKTKIAINAVRGTFTGINKKRVYLLDIHQSMAPKSVVLNGSQLKQYKTSGQFNKAADGYYFDKDDKTGTLHVKTQYLSTAEKQLIFII
jgi:alpha-glucosidase